MRATALSLVAVPTYRNGGLVCVAALVGFICWQGVLPAMVLLPVFVWCWSRAGSRWQAFTIALAYYLLASRCLLQVGANFWGVDALSPLRGFGVWIVPGLIIAGCWALCWSSRNQGLRALLAIAVTTLPPVGIIGWASPLSSAGALFPNCGWIGLVLTLGLLAVVCHQGQRAIVMCLMLAAVACNFLMPMPRALPPNWIGVQTHFGNPALPGTEFDRIMDMRTMAARILRNAPAGSVVVFPESLIGQWDVADGQLGRLSELARRKGARVLFGALSQRSGELVNGVFEPGQSVPTANSRMAIPLGLWRPWSDLSTKLSLLDAGIVRVQGHRAAFLICFEQLVNWPILVSLTANPELVVAPANVWFGDGGSLEGIQHQNAGSWARLFDIPVLFAANHQSQR